MADLWLPDPEGIAGDLVLETEVGRYTVKCRRAGQIKTLKRPRIGRRYIVRRDGKVIGIFPGNPREAYREAERDIQRRRNTTNAQDTKAGPLKGD